MRKKRRIPQPRKRRTRRQKATECVSFQDLFSRDLQVTFDQERTTSDGGGVLIAAADRELGLSERLAKAMGESRQCGKAKHDDATLLRQRMYSIACGYRDSKDAARLAGDPLMQILAGGDRPIQKLASQPTLSRFENAATTRSLHRGMHALADLVIEQAARTRKGCARWITIDLDTTVDPTHGHQQLTFFNAHYDTHCYMPMVAFIQFDDEPEQQLVAGLLRPGNSPDRACAVGLTRQLIAKLKAAFPGAEIRVRADGGFAFPELLEFLESYGDVKYAINMPKNSILERKGHSYMRAARTKFKKLKKADESVRVFGEFRYAAGSWKKCKRRIIMKAEITTYPDRAPRENPRFLVTNMKGDPRRVYERLYCMRGDAENRIKELKDSMALDRTSCCTILANQFRVLLSCAAYVLMQHIRRKAAGTEYVNAQSARMIQNLFKLGGRVDVSVRRIVIHLPLSAPARSDWQTIAQRLGAHAA